MYIKVVWCIHMEQVIPHRVSEESVTTANNLHNKFLSTAKVSAIEKQWNYSGIL